MTFVRLLAAVGLAFASAAVWAGPRQADPDGCLVCHALPGLEYIDERGVRRTATIDRHAFYASLHGSVPCRDCHRKIRDYPHDPKNGYVDCGAACHVEEPSEAEAFSHRDVVDEFKASVHGEGEDGGATSGFHGGNRLDEVENALNPSCRRCHYNEPYIRPDRLADFMEAFDHVDSECGSCHQGEVWRDQFAGHILRRLIGKHYSKQEANAMCVGCHDDVEMMKQVKIENPDTGIEEPAGPRFVFAVASYAKFLHARLLEVGVEDGAACIDCHAPEGAGFRHNVRRARDPESSTHEDRLADTCGQSGCHGDYAHDPRSEGFLHTDVHDLAWVPLDRIVAAGFSPEVVADSPWVTVLTVLGPAALLFVLGQLLWLAWERRDQAIPLLGGRSFQKIMLEMPVPPAWWTRWWRRDEAEAVPDTAGDAALDDSLTIVYGSQTGNAEGLAERLHDLAERWGLPVRLFNLADFDAARLVHSKFLFLLTSTQGEGEPPLNAQPFYHHLRDLSRREHEKPLLGHLRFAVFGLGDSSYTYFCQCGKDFDAFLEKLGAERILPRVDADVDFEEPAAEWMRRVIEVYQELSGHRGTPPPVEEEAAPQGYGKQRPYPAPLRQNRNLNGPGSAKETRHLELDLGDSGFTYEPGDVVGVYPRNDGRYVNALLQVLGWDGDGEVMLGEETLSLREALLGRLDVTALTRPLAESYAEATGDEALKALLADAEAFQAYAWGRQLIDLVEDHPPQGLSPQDFVALLRRIPPRLYSIASSLKKHPGQVHLCVGVVRYHSHGRDREGVCSNYLARRRPGDRVPIFFQANPHFRLPADPATDIIMVGPGTGIAPFRAFLEEREVTEAPGRNWLFFGDQHRRTDFLYGEQWLALQKRGILTRLDLAFSRDQAERIYVQHRMRENAAELYAWLRDGAHFYVCGDASRMAKDVHRALVEIAAAEGKMSEEAAEDWLKTLEREGRYQRDVY